MIVGSLTLRSAVSRDRDRLLATVVIGNDGSGSHAIGNYTITVLRPGGRARTADVKDFPRGSRSALELLRRGLNVLHDVGELP